MSDSITDAVVTSYLETLLWSETFHGQGDDGEDPLIVDGEEYEAGTSLDQIPGCDVSDLSTLAPAIVDEAREDLEGFRHSCLEGIGIDPFRFFDASQVAHDFALSRNGHGAGFFDRSYTVKATGIQTNRATTTNDGSIELNDELQECARDMGRFGLSVWTEENGNLKMESHT
jgi:hypothetical protein